MNSLFRFAIGRARLAQVLVFLLAGGPSVLVRAQEQAKPVPAQPMSPLPTVQTFRILVLAGMGGQNDLQRGIMTPLVVQVLDQNARPVEGAEVVFRFPQQGAGALFAGQKTFQTTMTNADGQAAATGWTARQLGRFEVQVTATRRNEMGIATVTMENVPTVAIVTEKAKRKGILSSRWAKIGLIGGAAGAAAAAVLLTRGGGGSTTTVIVGTGAPTIGGPR